MKDFVKLAVVALVAYYVGFYECKHKVQTLMLTSLATKENQEEA